MKDRRPNEEEEDIVAPVRAAAAVHAHPAAPSRADRATPDPEALRLVDSVAFIVATPAQKRMMHRVGRTLRANVAQHLRRHKRRTDALPSPRFDNLLPLAPVARRETALPIQVRRGAESRRPLSPGVAAAATWAASVSSRANHCNVYSMDAFAVSMKSSAAQLNALDSSLASARGAMMRRAKPFNQRSLDATSLGWGQEDLLAEFDDQLRSFHQALQAREDELQAADEDKALRVGGFGVDADEDTLNRVHGMQELLADASDRVNEPMTGKGGSLPHLDTLEAAFGMDLSWIQFFQCAKERGIASALGATAFAAGTTIYSETTELFTIAHEVAHCIQQRLGWVPSRYVSKPGDRFEVHADEVAAAVVAGRPVAPLMEAFAPSAAAHGEDMTRERRRNNVEPGYQDQLSDPAIPAHWEQTRSKIGVPCRTGRSRDAWLGRIRQRSWPNSSMADFLSAPGSIGSGLTGAFSSMASGQGRGGTPMATCRGVLVHNSYGSGAG